MSARDQLTGYDEMADVLEKLPLIVRETRRARRLILRDAAQQIGCSASTVMRFERGEGGTLDLVIRLLRWVESHG